MKPFLFSFFFTFLLHPTSYAQEKQWIRHQIATLSGTGYYGRGYVNKGVEKASNYLSRKFRTFGLKSFQPDSSYLQAYTFPVNTFPGEVALRLNKTEKISGEDYIINAASKGCFVNKQKVKTIDLGKVRDSLAWNQIKDKFQNNRAYLLKNADTLYNALHLRPQQFAATLPPGIFLIPQHGKLTWTVSMDTIAATIFYVEDTVMPKRIRKLSASVTQKFIPAFKSNNVIGMVPGTERPDSFILFIAHFDHLGMMGKSAMFPGAHDNASGTSLMLYLANYFAQHPQRYSMVFIGFSGEEAGLVGSDYFVHHPLLPLHHIRFVINMDMTGDATDGITVVNAQEQKKAFDLLTELNNAKGYLPEIKERGQTHNSDHYHFSEAGVPAIFIYGLGAKGFYHDIFDKANELSLNNIDKLSRLLIDFAVSLQ